MDLTMPGRGGIAAIAEIHESRPEVKVLVVTMHEDAGYARLAMLSGAAGYVLKKSLVTELVTAIRTVHRGHPYVTPSLLGAITQLRESSVQPHHNACGPELLTPREREVVSHVALGLTNTEIARRLSISEKTVETHRAHIVAKLGLRCRADLVRFALDYGLMPP
jgi:two-component system response regulator NreC